MSTSKRSISEYFFVAIFSIAMGIILIIIPMEMIIIGGIFLKLEGYLGFIILPIRMIVVSGWLGIVLLILSWYTLYKKDVILREYIAGITMGTIVLMIVGIILMSSANFIIGFLDEASPLIFKSTGVSLYFTGEIFLLFSPIISWYGVHTQSYPHIS